MPVNDWLRLREAALYYYKQTGDKVPALDTVRNWMTSGKDGYDGKRVKLRTVWMKNARVTREKWMDKFIEKIQRREISDTIQSQERKRRSRPGPH